MTELKMIPSEYPKVGLIRADSISVMITWFFMGLTGVLWLFQATGVHALEHAVAVALGAFFLAAGVHVTLAFLHKCPSCAKHPTIQGFKPPHPASLGQSRAQGWAGVVMSVVLQKRFVCIHCGAEYRA
ncbi:MAG: hypothetical protein ABWY02_13760 [Telluria sp.]